MLCYIFDKFMNTLLTYQVVVFMLFFVVSQC